MKSTSKLSVSSRTALVISDIHSNAPALRAVLAERLDNEPIICAGDIVGYYSDPNECCELIRDHCAVVIRGNHDAYTIGALQPKPQNREKYRTDWTRVNLSDINLSWLRSLPQSAYISLPERDIYVRHANLFDEEAYIYPDADLSGYAIARRTVFVLGHTHHPMLRLCGEGRIVNPGSVGQPRDRNPKAAFARLHLETGHVEFLRASYDVDTYQKALLAGGWPEETVSILSRSSAGCNR